MDKVCLAEPAAIGQDSSVALAGEEATGEHFALKHFRQREGSV